MKIPAVTLLCALFAALSAVSAPGQSATATAVHSFTGPDGSSPTSIIQASDGNLWGTAAEGGANNVGTIFKIYPDGTFATVYDFASPSNTQMALQPVSLIESGDGNFYGVTRYGGFGLSSYGYCQCGTFFRITPGGELTILYAFGNPCCENPDPGLLQGSDGNFYVSTVYGPVVISPVGTPLDFGAVSTQAIVAAGLLQHSNGTFYGASADYGIVYSYSLDRGLSLYNEDSGIGLGYSFAEGTDGNIYGAGNNVAFRFSPSGASKSFATSFDAATGLTAASDGNVYGVYNSGDGAPLFSIAPTGDVSIITTAGSPAIGSPLFNVAPIQASDGSFLIPFAEYATSTNAIYRYTLAPPLRPPVQLTPGESSIALGASFTLAWTVANPTSATLQQCNAFLTRPGNGGGNWSGLQSSTLSNGLFSGAATLTPTAGGTYTYSLTCGGVESGYATVIVTGGTASASTTLLQSSATSVVTGSPVTLTATVTSNTAGSVPTGTVTFRYGSRTLGSATLSQYGVATFTASTTGLPGGSFGITAHYAGDSNDSPSNSAILQIALEGVTASSLAISPTSVPVGAPANGVPTITATVRTVHGGPTPTGIVQFNSTEQGNSYSFGSASLNSSGLATLSSPTMPLIPGIYPVTATYSGDSYNQPSTSAVVTLYITSPTTTALSIYPASVAEGQFVTLTTTITATGNSSSVVSGGTVTFTSGPRTIATAKVNANGIASVNILVKNIPPGTYPVVANFKGTPIYLPSSSAASNVTVTQ